MVGYQGISSVYLFEETNMSAIHGRRITVMPRDMQLAHKI
eukprot:CCRYP_018082-RA/>CCRYP_018082-RA protein AED:0.34 eAED:0.34 QI:0/-1/0/1/-1/0/1/0/39